jgi:hypothetical protein
MVARVRCGIIFISIPKFIFFESISQIQSAIFYLCFHKAISSKRFGKSKCLVSTQG